MHYRILPVTPFAQNCTLLWCERTRRAVLVDPGGEVPRLLAALRELGVTLERILLTHGHLDHVGGTGDLVAELGVPVEGPHRGDELWIRGLAEQGRMFGLPRARPFSPDRWLEEGDSICFGAQRLEVLHCPGHTPGHLVFYHPDDALALVGDVLFRGSIGRTDFPGGDHAALIRSIRGKLWPLGDHIRFIPGHGPMSTFGEERRANPFVADG